MHLVLHFGLPPVHLTEVFPNLFFHYIEALSLDSRAMCPQLSFEMSVIFLYKILDPSDVESPPRASLGQTAPTKFPVIHPTPPLSPNEEISFVLGTMQVCAREVVK